jgi:hypothetical protein
MRQKSKALVGAAIVLASFQLYAADLSAGAIRDAKRLVACMKEFDAACANSLTYTKALEDQGVSRDRLDRVVTGLYQDLKSMGARYSRFELGAAGQPFVLREKTYIFIPYEMQLVADGKDTSLKAFFVGVSEDFGNSWKFFDGQRLTRDNVGTIIPGYQGAPLPEVSRSQTDAQ